MLVGKLVPISTEWVSWGKEYNVERLENPNDPETIGSPRNPYLGIKSIYFMIYIYIVKEKLTTSPVWVDTRDARN